MSDSDKGSGARLSETDTIGAKIIRMESPLPGDHRFYPLIGRVASEWTHFERILDEIIRDIADIPEGIALCITGQMMGATPRFKTIDALGKHVGLSEALLKKFRRLKQKNYDVVEFRNRVVHDPWFRVREFDDEGIETESVTQLKSSPPGPATITEPEITETIRKIKNLIIQTAQIGKEVRDELQTLRGK